MLVDLKARILTVGTELTVGEVVNSNAAWVSLRLEDQGIRVFSHLTVRDDRAEIAQGLASLNDADILIVTGGLGPTSDDITRECLAHFAGVELEFDQDVWGKLQSAYEARGLRLLPAHKQQCYFPKGSLRLPNSAGTALGFAMSVEDRRIYVLPGPPAELQRMWLEEVEPRLAKQIPPHALAWERWTVLGLPESEVADRVDAVLKDTGIEAGYRASYPYVLVKAYLDHSLKLHQQKLAQITQALASHSVARGLTDGAEELLKAWPEDHLTIVDGLTDNEFLLRLLGARKKLKGQRVPVVQSAVGLPMPDPVHLHLTREDDHFAFRLRVGKIHHSEPAAALPFKVPLDTERGRKGAVENIIWRVLKLLNGL